MPTPTCALSDDEKRVLVTAPLTRWFSAPVDSPAFDATVQSLCRSEFKDKRHLADVLGRIEGLVGVITKKRAPRRLQDLPLGTRFSYLHSEQVWVLLDKSGCGLIAKWGGVNGPVAGQSICSVCESEQACQVLTVLVPDQ